MQRKITLDANGNYKLDMRMRLKTMLFYNSAADTVNVYLTTSIGAGNGLIVPSLATLEIEKWDTECEDFNSIIFNGTVADNFVVFWTEYPTQYSAFDGTQPQKVQ